MKAASIDLGTNTFRLLAIEKRGNSTVRVLDQMRRVVRLGEGLANTKEISPQARERALAVLREFRSSLEGKGVEQVFAVATSVFREAQNAQPFLREASRVLGTPIRVISGEEEARLTLLGGLWSLEAREGVLFDIGGGSTEFIRFVHSTPRKLVSTPMGVVKLTETFLHHDPPTSQEVEALKGAVKEEMERVLHTLGPVAPTLIGTAGTVTTLAAIDLGLSIYHHSKVHGHLLTRRRIEELLQAFLATTREERLRMKGMEEGREDLIIPGTIITLQAMGAWEKEELIVSDLGLREGVLLDGLGCRKGN